MTDNTGTAVREQAARAVRAVISQGRSLDDAMADWADMLNGADQALARLLAYGVLRDHRRLGALMAPRLKKRPKPLLDALLRVGLYQLEATRIPPHAAVHATVEATKRLGLNKTRGMVNAILRAHQREPASVSEARPGEYYSYPDWLLERIRADWDEAAPEVLAAGNARAPMHTRVNARRTSREAVQTHWQQADISARAMALCRDGLTLDQPQAADSLPGFPDGRVSIQDGAAQLAADLVFPANGDRVLDACAAPGNKSAHLLERADIDLTALDVDAGRLQTLKATLARLGLSATVLAGDAAQPDYWWDGQPFDRILLDAPCSGTGVIRRHPDIKWLRRESDIRAAAQRQRQLLATLWPLLKPGGRLVYATCSILRAEGADVVRDFLASTDDARAVPIEVGWGRQEIAGRRLAPGDHDFDGFYYAVLTRRAG